MQNQSSSLTRRRLLAGAIDFILVVILVNTLISEKHFYNSDEFINSEPSCEHVCQAWKVIAYTAVFIPYGLVTEGLFGRTLGKALTGLRVDCASRRLRFWRIALRNFLRISWLLPIPGIGLMADIVMIAFVPQNQRLGDLLAGTTVVKTRRSLTEDATPVNPVAGQL
jgi:uncharacterized RDD family membrane protein YckC